MKRRTDTHPHTHRHTGRIETDTHSIIADAATTTMHSTVATSGSAPQQQRQSVNGSDGSKTAMGQFVPPSAEQATGGAPTPTTWQCVCFPPFLCATAVPSDTRMSTHTPPQHTTTHTQTHKQLHSATQPQKNRTRRCSVAGTSAAQAAHCSTWHTVR